MRKITHIPWSLCSSTADLHANCYVQNEYAALFKGFHFEHLRASNASKRLSQKYRRNSTLIVEEHVRNKRRRFTTREIYFTSRPRAYISIRKKRERENHLVRVTNDSLSFLMQRVKGLTLRASGVDFARGKHERRFLDNF